MRGSLFPALALATTLSVLLPVAADAAWPEACSGLDAGLQARAKTLMSGVYPHDCCDDTLWNCLQQQGASRLVTRLAAGVCLRLANGESDKDILREQEKRAASMMATGRAAIDTSGVVWAGDATAPVEVVVYACARCPFCSKSIPEIYEAVVTGHLKGKARLGFRLFPVKSHPNSKEGGLAFEAARSLKVFWPYVLLVFRKFDQFKPEELAGWAVEVGMARDAFAAEMNAAATRDRLVASKKEGLKNQVEATPTYFIDGKLYRADLKTWALSCAIQEEHDRIEGNLCKPE